MLHKNPKILKLEEYRKSGIEIGDNVTISLSTVEEYITKNYKNLVNFDGMNATDIQKLIIDNQNPLIERKPMAWQRERN